MFKLNLPNIATSAIAGGISSARQKLMYQPEEEEEKWYKGQTPTSSETLARIFTISKSNPASGEPLWNAYMQFADDPSSPLFNPYTRPTNPAISQISALGVDTSSGINKNWFGVNAGLKNFYRTGTSGTPLAPSSSSTPENDAAYWYYKIGDAEETTVRAETEWDALRDELSFWTGWEARNYSDDEVLGKVNWSDYPTLVKMDEGRQNGLPLYLNRSVGYSQDAMTGVIWAKRNNGGTGNGLADSVKNALGDGNRWVENEDISARLDPSNDRYNPYSVGSTMDDAALYFGVYGFDAEWLEKNKAYMATNDQTAKRLYQSVYDAEQLTQRAEGELTALWEDINRRMSYSSDPEKILSWIDWDAYPTLAKMDESLKSGDLLSLTRAVDYRKQDVTAEVQRRCTEKLQVGQDYASGVAASMGVNGLRSQADNALVTSRNGLLDASGQHVMIAGTDEEQRVFRVAKDAGFSADVGVIRQAIMKGETDTAKSYAQTLQAADAYAADKYLGALEATMPYEAALAARDEAQAELDALLTQNPVLALYKKATAPLTQDQAYADEEAYIEARHQAETLWKPLFERVNSYGTSTGYPEMDEWHDLLYIDHLLHNEDGVWDFASVDAKYSPEAMDDATYDAELDRLRKQRDGLDWDSLMNPETAEMKQHNRQADLWLEADALINGTPIPEDKTAISAEEWIRLENQYNAIDWSDGKRMITLQNTIADQDAIVKEMEPGYAAGLDEIKAVRDMYADANLYASVFGVPASENFSTMALLDYAYKYGANYKPTEWSSQTMYDAALAEGFTYEQVAGAAKEGVSAYQARLDSLNLMVSELAARGIGLGDEYVQNIQREISLMERNIADAEYFQLEENADFDQVVENTRKQITDAWNVPGLFLSNAERSGYTDVNYLVAGASDRFIADTIESSSGVPLVLQMDDREKDRYLYLLGTQGQDAAGAYLAHLTDDSYGILQTRTTEKLQEAVHQLADDGFAGGATATALSIIASPTQLMGAAYTAISGLQGKEVNPYNVAFSPSVVVGESRSTVKENLTEHFGEGTPGAFFANLGYDALTSAGDSMANAVTFGPAGSAAMGLSAGGSAARSAKMRGASDMQALEMGAAATAAEVLSESASNAKILRLFKDPPADFAEALVDAVWEAGKEGVSEMASEAMMNASDNEIMGELSNFNTAVESYKASGMTEEEAQNKAAGDALAGIFYAGATGSISSGMSSAAAGTAGRALNSYGRSVNMEAARTIAALDQAIATPSDSARTATIAAVLSGGGEATAEHAASAAAQHLADRYGTETATRVTKQVILEAEATGIKSEAVQVALTVAGLAEGGEAEAQMNAIVSGDKSPERIAGLLEAAAHDEANLGDMISGAMTDNMVATRVKELIADGGMSGLQSYESAASQARQNLNNAKANLEQAQTQRDTASQNLATVSSQYLNDPTNPSLRGTYQQAIKDVESAAIVHKQMEQSVNKYEGQLEEASAMLESARDTSLKQLREQAVADVAVMQHEENNAREQQKMAEEGQRQVNNVNALEAENFIADSGYNGMPDAQLDQVRQEVISTAKPVEVSRANVEFAAQVSKRFALPIIFGDGEGQYAGSYDKARGVIKLDRGATQGDVIRKTVAHELTHRAEESGHYKELAETLLALHYNGNTEAQQADLDAIRAQYADVYTTDAEFETELVSHAAEEVLGNEESMNRIVAEKPSLARRIWESLKSFINKMRGVNDPVMDTLRRAENLLSKSLDDVSKQGTGKRSGMQYSLQTTGDGTKYVEVDTDQDIFDGRSTKEYPRIARIYIKNRFRHTIIGEGANQAYVDARTGNEYTNPAASVAQEAFAGKMRAATELDNLVTASEFTQHNEPTDRHPEFPGGFDLYKTVFNVGGHMFEGVLNIGIDNQGRRRLYDLTHLKSLDPGVWVKQHGGAAAQTSDRGSDNSIPSSSDSVKLKKLVLGLPSADLRRMQLEAWRNPSQAPEGQAEQPNRAERQFASQTAQNSQAMPEELRQELLSNDAQHYYETDTNRAQLERAWEQYQQDGFEASRDRILQAEHLTTDDTAMANLLMALAFRSGDVNSAMELAHRYNVEGTEQGQALQARQIFSRMTPTGARAWVAGGMETQLAEHMRTHQRQRQRIDQQAQQIADDIQDMQGGDELARLNAAREFTIDESNNRWGVPINEQQQALIDQYQLNNVRRPGVFYNRATTQQRMLEAILATPNPLELTGNGLNLIQRLEYLQAGEAVVTNADLDYIGYHLAAFAASDADTQNGREGDLHLSRAYEAYGNITPATGREKARTWRYTSMLLSVPSALRNVMGNAMQNTINAASQGLAVELDRLVSQITGERTKAHLTAAERVEGWQGFVEETQNTFRDFFTDRAITHHGEDRYNLNQRGRVFQGQIPEALRLVEGYLMSVGDRNFWRKAYLNSMAEQQRVADQSGVDLDYTAAVERATHEANYATFNEDNAVRDALGALKSVPVVGEVLDFVMPFTGVPTNIVSRMWQYSPMGLATSAIRHAYRGLSGQDFNQLDFVNSMARGLTGTALFAVGMALGSLGYIKLGTGEEEDKKIYGIESAQGKQYAPYIQIGDEYISLSAFAPAVSPLIAGAAAFDIFQEDEDHFQSLYNAATAMLDQILDASYMSNLKDIFGGYGSTAENIGNVVLSSSISQNIPSVISQLALALDPYVRDTKDKNTLIQTLNSGLIQKIPFLREILPEKVDVAGRSVASKEGLRNFFDPLTTSRAIDDPALNELMRLYQLTGVSTGFPTDALSGTKTTLTGVLGEVAGEDKENFKKRYGELWRLGGSTFDEDGNRVTLKGVTDLIQTPAYQRMDIEEKYEAIGGIVEAAKAGAIYEMGEKLGHAPKTKSTSDEYKMQAVRAMPERFAQSDSPWIQELAAWYDKTGDGAFIPKGIGSSFSRSKVQYDLSGAEYDELWSLYETELDVRLAKIDWTASDEEVAQAVNSAYSSAASAAKDKYVKTKK